MTFVGTNNHARWEGERGGKKLEKISFHFCNILIIIVMYRKTFSGIIHPSMTGCRNELKQK
jgi:hypothetical protein